MPTTSCSGRWGRVGDGEGREYEITRWDGSTGYFLGSAESRTGVLFCDLDHSNVINDTFGHATDDLVLQAVARRLELQLRDSDTVARTGGDEFVVLLEDLAAPEVTCSIGISLSARGDDRFQG